MREELAELDEYLRLARNIREWTASTSMSGVLPHERMLPVGRLSFWPRLSLFNSMVEGCGHVVEGCGGG